MRSDDQWSHEMDCSAEECHRIAAHAVPQIREWLTPVLVGGLSAGRFGTVHGTAERLAETILIGIDNTLRGRHGGLFDPDDELPY